MICLLEKIDRGRARADEDLCRIVQGCWVVMCCLVMSLLQG